MSKEVKDLKEAITGEISNLLDIVDQLTKKTLKHSKEKLDMVSNRIKFYIKDI